MAFCTFAGAHGRPLMKKNWRSVPARPSPGANLEMRPSTRISLIGAGKGMGQDHVKIRKLPGLRRTYFFPTSPFSPRRRRADFSGITSKHRSRSTRLSSCFRPQSAPTEFRTEVAPSVRSWVVFFLTPPLASLTAQRGHPKNTYDTYPPSGVLETVRMTPLFSLVQGTSEYAVRRFNAFVNSRFAWRSSSFRLTGSGTNKPVTVTVVPRYVTFISMYKRILFL